MPITRQCLCSQIQACLKTLLHGNFKGSHLFHITPCPGLDEQGAVCVCVCVCVYKCVYMCAHSLSLQELPNTTRNTITGALTSGADRFLSCTTQSHLGQKGPSLPNSSQSIDLSSKSKGNLHAQTLFKLSSAMRRGNSF